MSAGWSTHLPRLTIRDYVRELEPEYSLLWAWRDRYEQWREQLRPRLVELMGLPAHRCDLQVRELDTIDCEGYWRTKLAYEVEEGLTASAWVCVPHDNESPLPAVVCAHPRGAGKDALVGLAGDPHVDHHPAYAHELATRGYVTLAPDARCFGERLDSERGLAAAGALIGRPLMGMQAWDLSRAVDYLCRRPDVRSDRVGISGMGMGAVHAVFAAAVDERIACTGVCAGLSTYRELLVARDCFAAGEPPPDLPPGLLRYADLDDVACLIAPRPLMMVQSTADSRVPARGGEECLERVAAGYELMGEKIRAQMHTSDGPACYPTNLLYQFMDDWLKL